MSNLTSFADSFFDILTMQEDLEAGHSYKAYLREAVRAFLKDETQENAFEVYRAFFDSYRVTFPDKDNPFVDLVDVLRSYEATAATLIDKQRDHFIHSVNVFISGLAVYAKNARYREAFASAVLEVDFPCAFRGENEEFFFRWGVAALFHDVGYPVEIIGHQINRFIRMVTDADGEEVKVRAKISYENFNELNHIREVIPKRAFTKAYYDAYESCSYVDLLTPLDLLAHRIHLAHGTNLTSTKAALDGFADRMAATGFIDHGYYSAIIVLKWYGYAMQITGERPERFFWQITDSAQAILLHNYYRNALQKAPFDLGPMPVKSNPLAFLLILCDELQEWNREARGIVTRTFTKADTVNLSVTDKYLAATYVSNGGSLPPDFCAEKKALLASVLNLSDIFPAGLDIDAEDLGNFAPLTERLSQVSARPLLKDLELLAIAIHARYNEKRMEDFPGQPLDYPDFSTLPDDLKYSNLRQAQGIYEKLERFGYTLRPKGSEGEIKSFPPDVLEAMSELEHEEWVRERISLGWTLGEKDTVHKVTPYLVPYNELTEEIKDYDRDTIRNIPALADRIGLAVCSLI